MQYLMLIYANEQVDAQQPQEVQATRMGEWNTYAHSLGATGMMKGGEALLPISAATTVRAANGQTLISDGPFAETKEQLGGFFLIDAPNLDEAIAWAARMPHVADGGCVEIRPIRIFDTESAPAESAAVTA